MVYIFSISFIEKLQKFFEFQIEGKLKGTVLIQKCVLILVESLDYLVNIEITLL